MERYNKMDKTTHTLRDFVEFSKTHPFRIPFYQRGYVWGKKGLMMRRIQFTSFSIATKG